MKMFRKSKSRSNLRQRQRSDGDEQTADESKVGTPDVPNGGHFASSKGSSESSEKVIKADGGTAQPSMVNPKPNSLLSFDDVEGDDVIDFKLRKKDRRSKRMEKLAKKAKSLEPVKEEPLDENDETEKEEKQKPERSVRQEKVAEEARSPVSVSVATDVDGPHYGPNGVLFGSVKEPDDNGENTNGKDTVRTKFSASFTGQIPDAQAVYEARKKREKLRQAGSTIPLDDVQRLKDNSVVRSRLIREDENDMSDDDEGSSRFYSAKALVQNEEERRRNDHSEFLAAEEGDDRSDQSDEELMRWEKEQMMKGVSSFKVELLERERKKMAMAMRSMFEQYEVPPEIVVEQQPMEMDVDVPDTPSFVASSHGRVTGHTTSVTLEGVLSRLRLRIKDRDEALNAREEELSKVEGNLEENAETSAKLESDEPHLREQFEMYQQMRAYTSDLMECLSEKVELLDSLELEVRGILKDRATRLRQRRRQDTRDVYDECAAAAAGRVGTLGRPPDALFRAAEREGRRARRRRLRENTLEGVAHEEGLSTDDEETNSEVIAREGAMAKACEAARAVFADTLDDYCRVGSVVARFVQWLTVDEASFTDAYIQLFIPKLLSPFIRLEMIDWCPLENDDRPFYMMHWYEELLACGSTEAGVSYEHPVILSLIPLCIEKVVLPRVIAMITDEWDVLSERQAERLSFLLDSLFVECPSLGPSSVVLKRLLLAICDRLRDAIEEDLFIPVYTKQALESPATGCRAFLDRQFWTAIKLTRTLHRFSKILSAERIDSLLLEGIANKRLVVALQCSVSTDLSILRKCRAVVKAIPLASWVAHSNTSLRSLHAVISRFVDELRHRNRDFAKEIQDTISPRK